MGSLALYFINGVVSSDAPQARPIAARAGPPSLPHQAQGGTRKAQAAAARQDQLHRAAPLLARQDGPAEVLAQAVPPRGAVQQRLRSLGPRVAGRGDEEGPDHPHAKQWQVSTAGVDAAELEVLPARPRLRL